VAVGQALLAGVPALLLALVPRLPAVRAAGRAWALAALASDGAGQRNVDPIGVAPFLGWALTRASRLPVTLPVGRGRSSRPARSSSWGASATLPARRAGRVDLLRAIAAE
jgi:hypothetical protein